VPARHGLSLLHVSRQSPPCCPCDWHGSDQPDPGHGGWDHRPLLDGSSTVGVPCATAALDTPEATWAPLAYPATPDGAVVLVTTVNCGATLLGHRENNWHRMTLSLVAHGGFQGRGCEDVVYSSHPISRPMPGVQWCRSISSI